MPYADQAKQNAYQRERYRKQVEAGNPPKRRARSLGRENELRRLRRQNDPEYARREDERTKAWRKANGYKIPYGKIPPSRKLRLNVAFRVNQSLRGKGRGGAKLIELLGYTIDDLRLHLERQFLKGMTWDNRGEKWHIDHIRPVSSFNIQQAGDADFRACWALTNLRPLWTKQNLLKGSHRTHLL